MKIFGMLVSLAGIISFSLLYRGMINPLPVKQSYQTAVITPERKEINDIDINVITETPIPTRTPTITPTAKPTQLPLSDPSDINSSMEKYARMESIDKNLLVSIAVCESNLNPQAVNGPYGGLFQFTATAWKNIRQEMNSDINPDLRFNSDEAIRTAAYVIARGRTNIWPNCSK